MLERLFFGKSVPYGVVNKTDGWFQFCGGDSIYRGEEVSRNKVESLLSWNSADGLRISGARRAEPVGSEVSSLPPGYEPVFRELEIISIFSVITVLCLTFAVNPRVRGKAGRGKRDL